MTSPAQKHRAARLNLRREQHAASKYADFAVPMPLNYTATFLNRLEARIAPLRAEFDAAGPSPKALAAKLATTIRCNHCKRKDVALTPTPRGYLAGFGKAAHIRMHCAQCAQCDCVTSARAAYDAATLAAADTAMRYRPKNRPKASQGPDGIPPPPWRRPEPALPAQPTSFYRSPEEREWYERRHEHMQTEAWKTLRRIALQAADNRCQLCNSGHRLRVHHRTYKNLGRETLRDVTVLCDECHTVFHTHRPLPEGHPRADYSQEHKGDPA